LTNALTRTITELDFGKIFSPLAIQLQWRDADEAAIRSYYRALCDIPQSVLTRSAWRLANERGRKFFPTTGEWRDVALMIEQEDRRSEFAGPHEWTEECTDCHDTGWRGYECTGLDGGCDRKFNHRPHDYVRICPCRESNRTYQRHQWKAHEK
jgi:hypothetical protein